MWPCWIFIMKHVCWRNILETYIHTLFSLTVLLRFIYLNVSVTMLKTKRMRLRSYGRSQKMDICLRRQKRDLRNNQDVNEK